MNDKSGDNSSISDALTNSISPNTSDELSGSPLLTIFDNEQPTQLGDVAPEPPSPAVKIAGFKIVKTLGRGGMGIVYEAVEVELNRRVALKVLPHSAWSDERQISRFKYEARAVAQLHHENIVPIYKVGSDRDVHYYTMQLIEGLNLAQIIGGIKTHVDSNAKIDTKRRTNARTKPDSKSDSRDSKSKSSSSSRKRIDFVELASALSSGRHGAQELTSYQAIAEFGAEIAAALAHAHELGVIHRDVKPSNILVDEQNKPWVADFGLALVRNATVATKPGDIVGTYRYMSPEQATGRRFLIDHRTDIYSLGVTLYELATQKLPFPGTEPHELLRQVSFDEPKSVKSANPAIPEELDIIITKAISRNPQDRYDSAHDMCEDLKRFASGRPIQAKRASLLKRAKRWAGRHQGMVASTAIIFIGLLITSLIATSLIWTAYASEQTQRAISEVALDRSKGLLLIANSQLTRSINPGLALCLAVEGAKHASGPEVYATILAALKENYERKTIFLPETKVGQLDLSHDGRFALCTPDPKRNTSKEGIVALDIDGGKVIRSLGSHVTSAQFQPQRTLVLTASSQGLRSNEQGAVSHKSENAQLLDMRNPDTKIVLAESAPLHLQRECFSHDGRMLVLPAADTSVAVYDGATGERKLVFQQHPAQVALAIVSGDGNRAGSLDVSGQIFVWNPTDGSIIAKFKIEPKFLNQPKLGITIDGRVLIVSSKDETIALDTTQDPPKIVGRWTESEFTIRPHHSHVACYSNSSRSIKVRSLTEAEQIVNIPTEFPPTCVAYSADGRNLIVALNDYISVLDPNSGKEQFRLKGHASLVQSVAIDDNFKSIISCSEDNSIRVWSTKSMLDLESIEVSPNIPIPTRDNFVSFEQTFASATDAMLESAVIDSKSQRLRRIGPGRIGDGSQPTDLTVLIDNNYVRIFDQNTSRKIAELGFPGVPILNAIHCGGSTKVLIQFHDYTWCIWDYAKLITRRLPIDLKRIISCQLSPDAQQTVLLSYDGDCRVYSLPEGKLIHALPHENNVNAVIWSKNRGIFTLDKEGLLRRWELGDQDLKCTWTSNTSKANSLAIHESQDQVIAFHSILNQKMTSWSMESGELKRSRDGSKRISIKPHPTLPLVLECSKESGSSLWDLTDGNVTQLSKNRCKDGEFTGDFIVVAEIGVVALKHPYFFRSDSGTSELVYYNSESKELIRKVPLNRLPFKLAANQSGRNLILSYETWLAAIGDLKTGQIDYSPSFGAQVSAIRHLPSNGSWLVASLDGTALLLNREGKNPQTIVSQDAPITAIAVSQDNKRCAIGDLTGVLRVFEIETGIQIYEGNNHDQPIRQVDFLRNQYTLLSLCSKGRLVRTSLEDKSTKEYFPEPGVRSFLLSADKSRALLCTGFDEITPLTETQMPVVKFDLDTGNPQLLIVDSMTADDFIRSKAYCADIELSTDRVAIVTDNRTLSINDLATKRTIRTWELSESIIAVKWIGKNRLAGLSDVNRIMVWNTQEGSLDMEIIASKASVQVFNTFRHLWSPVDFSQEVLIGHGPDGVFRRYPLNVYEFASRKIPRQLTREESLLYLGPTAR
jgi:serine/threonine protein kinase/WD40 repeat protein